MECSVKRTVTRNTSNYITKRVLASGDSIHFGLPKEFVSVLNNICSNFSVLEHNNLLIKMIVNGDIPFGGNSLNNGVMNLYSRTFLIRTLHCN